MSQALGLGLLAAKLPISKWMRGPGGCSRRILVLHRNVMGALSFTHWLIVGLVVVLLFGGKKLGEVGKGLGEGIREFKKGMAGTGAEDQDRGAPKRLERAPDERADS